MRKISLFILMVFAVGNFAFAKNIPQEKERKSLLNKSAVFNGVQDNTNNYWKIAELPDEFYSEGYVLQDLSIVNRNIIWAAATVGDVTSASKACVLKSLDGGKSFSIVKKISNVPNISSITALDENIAFITAGAQNPTTIYRTEDGGQNWNSVYHNDGAWFNFIDKIDDNNLWAQSDPIGGYFLILKSIDKGLTWIAADNLPLSQADEYGVMSSYDRIDNVLWFGSQSTQQGGFGRIFKSENGVDGPWQIVNANFNGVKSISFTNPNGRGVVTGLNSYDIPMIGYSGGVYYLEYEGASKTNIFSPKYIKGSSKVILIKDGYFASSNDYMTTIAKDEDSGWDVGNIQIYDEETVFAIQTLGRGDIYRLTHDKRIRITGEIFPSALTLNEGQIGEVKANIFITDETIKAGATTGLSVSLVIGKEGDDLRWADKRIAKYDAIFNRDVDSLDEFKATISGLAAGTYSYAFCFTYNNLEYTIGYVNTPDDGFYRQGKLTINPKADIDVSHWANYIGCGRVVAIAEDENYIWAGGTGLARINKTTDEITLYTRVNSGLPDNNVMSIHVDKNGNKWISTGSGLAKFDGTNWTSFTTENSTISSNFTYDLAEDSKGNIWVGTYNGISKFDGSNWSNYESTLWSSSSSYKAAYELAIDNNDVVWGMVSYSGALIKYDGATWTLYERGKSFIPQNATTRAIAVDKSNKLWLSYMASGKYGVIVYDGTNSIDYNTSNTPALPQSYFLDIFVDENDNKWFAGNGYVIFDNNNWTVVNAENSGISDTYKNCIISNSSGEIYVGTDYGVDKFRGSWKNYSFGNKPELNYYGVQGFTEAPNGDVWINSWEGLTKVSNGIWTSYNSQNTPYLNSQINKIVFDKNGTLCVGLTNGFAKYDGSNWQLFDKTNSGLLDTYVWDIAVDPSANIWLATDAGIVKYDGVNWTTYTKADRGYAGSTSEQVVNIVSDSKGNIFAAWNGGLAVLKDNVWINYDSKNSILKSNYVSSYSLDSDKNDNIWWSTNSYGAYEYTNDGVWKEYNTTNSGLPSNSVRKVFIDAQNNIWFCTYGWGVAKYDGTTWSNLTTSNSGLGCNSTRSILIDKNGNYWIGSFAGLSYYNPNVVGVEQDYQNIPTQFELCQNYPNPFNPETTIKYQIPESGYITLKVYDILGREVAMLVNENKNSGEYQVKFNGTNLASGVYFYCLQAKNFVLSKKMILIR